MSERAHSLTSEEIETIKEKLQPLEMETDEIVAALLGISKVELRDIQSSLADLK